jgi:hypothetical protein
VVVAPEVPAFACRHGYFFLSSILFALDTIFE